MTRAGFSSDGVAVADSYSFVFQGVEVDYDAERGADFVLAAVALADVAVVVPHYGAQFFLQHGVNFAGFVYQLGFVL